MIDKEFESRGVFFLPNKKENIISGTLYFHPIDGIKLDLIGDFQNITFQNIASKEKREDVVFGVLSDGNIITLFNNLRIGTTEKFTFRKGNDCIKPIITYKVHYVLYGIHILNEKNPKFTSVACEIFNLDEWMGISGFKNNFEDSDKEFSIKFIYPESINFTINEECSAYIKHYATREGDNIHQKFSLIKQKVYLHILFNEEKEIFEIFNHILKFQNFLTLGLYRSTYIQSVTFKNKKFSESYIDNCTNKEESYEIPIKLLFAPPLEDYSRIQKLKPKLDMYMFFNYKSIQENFSTIIKEWYKKYELMESSFNLLFQEFNQPNRFSVSLFLNVAQATESFHAKLYPSQTKISKQEYGEMKKNILSSTPGKYHKWLNEQFNFGNLPSLHNRLSDLYEKYYNPFISKIIPDKESFIKDVKNSRNFYTHYSKNLEKKALKGHDLYKLTQRLKILLISAILIEIGFSPEKVYKSLENIKGLDLSYLINES